MSKIRPKDDSADFDLFQKLLNEVGVTGAEERLLIFLMSYCLSKELRRVEPFSSSTHENSINSFYLTGSVTSAFRSGPLATYADAQASLLNLLV